MLFKYIQTKTRHKLLELSVLIIARSSYKNKCKNCIQVSPLQRKKKLSVSPHSLMLHEVLVAVALFFGAWSAFPTGRHKVMRFSHRSSF